MPESEAKPRAAKHLTVRGVPVQQESAHHLGPAAAVAYAVTVVSFELLPLLTSQVPSLSVVPPERTGCRECITESCASVPAHLLVFSKLAQSRCRHRVQQLLPRRNRVQRLPSCTTNKMCVICKSRSQYGRQHKVKQTKFLSHSRCRASAACCLA